jgi:short-subunit dehydrogenase
MKSFENKVIWITGASSGIGEALAKECNRSGAEIIISARRIAELERVRESCQDKSKVHLLPVDLSKQDEFPELVKKALSFKGKIDILINNAGISQRSRAADTDLAVDRKIMEVNYFGTVALTKALLPHFLEKKQGHFVVVSSLVGKFATPLRSSYAASKHALHGFFDSLRAEQWKENLKVTIVCPGFIKTDITYHALTGDGTPQNKMDDAQKNGMPADVFARRMVKAMISEKQEVYIGGKETYAVYLKRFFPALLSRVIRKAKVV